MIGMIGDDGDLLVCCMDLGMIMARHADKALKDVPTWHDWLTSCISKLISAGAGDGLITLIRKSQSKTFFAAEVRLVSGNRKMEDPPILVKRYNASTCWVKMDHSVIHTH